MHLNRSRLGPGGLLFPGLGLGLGLAVLIASGGAAAPADAAAKWEKDIAAFEAADRESPPGKGGVLFVGSSSVRLWKTLEEDFPDDRVLNRGFGGSQMSDLLAFVDRIILPYEPSVVLVYEGDNDLAANESPKAVVDEFAMLVDRVHEALPKTHLVFLSVKPSPKRARYLAWAAETNERIARFCATRREVSYVDLYWPLMGADGRPNPRFYDTDELHLNAEGYRVWAEIVRGHLAGIRAARGDDAR